MLTLFSRSPGGSRLSEFRLVRHHVWQVFACEFSEFRVEVGRDGVLSIDPAHQVDGLTALAAEGQILLSRRILWQRTLTDWTSRYGHNEHLYVRGVWPLEELANSGRQTQSQRKPPAAAMQSRAAVTISELSTKRGNQPQVSAIGGPHTRSQVQFLSQSSWASVKRDPATRLLSLPTPVASVPLNPVKKKL